MKKLIIVFLIIVGCLFILFISFNLITKALLKTDSFKKQVIENRLDIKLPDSTKIESFVSYDDDLKLSIILERPVAVRALLSIDISDEELFIEQLIAPTWEIGNDGLHWQGSYWEDYDLDDAIALYYQSLPVYFQKSQGEAYIAIFKVTEENKLIVGFNFIG